VMGRGERRGGGRQSGAYNVNLTGPGGLGLLSNPAGKIEGKLMVSASYHRSPVSSVSNPSDCETATGGPDPSLAVPLPQTTKQMFSSLTVSRREGLFPPSHYLLLNFIHYSLSITGTTHYSHPYYIICHTSYQFSPPPQSYSVVLLHCHIPECVTNLKTRVTSLPSPDRVTNTRICVTSPLPPNRVTNLSYRVIHLLSIT